MVISRPFGVVPNALASRAADAQKTHCGKKEVRTVRLCVAACVLYMAPGASERGRQVMQVGMTPSHRDMSIAANGDAARARDREGRCYCCRKITTYCVRHPGL